MEEITLDAIWFVFQTKLGLFPGKGAFMVRAAFSFLKWLFRSQLLVAAISSYVFFISVGEVRDAFHSNGPYLIPGPEYSDEILHVSRHEYLRHEAVSEIFMSLMALMFWGLAAHSLEEAEKERKKEIRYLKWKLAEYEKMPMDNLNL